MPILSNPRWEKFAQLRAASVGIQDAHEQAGFKRNAGNAGRLNKNEQVQRRIAELQAAAVEKTTITQARVVEEITFLALMDAGDLAGITRMSGPEDVKKLPENVRRCIVGWSWDKAGNFTLKIADKLAALDKLARYTGMYSNEPGDGDAPPLKISIEVAPAIGDVRVTKPES